MLTLELVGGPCDGYREPVDRIEPAYNTMKMDCCDELGLIVVSGPFEYWFTGEVRWDDNEAIFVYRFREQRYDGSTETRTERSEDEDRRLP